jgi:hypothetical protein
VHRIHAQSQSNEITLSAHHWTCTGLFTAAKAAPAVIVMKQQEDASCVDSWETAQSAIALGFNQTQAQRPANLSFTNSHGKAVKEPNPQEHQQCRKATTAMLLHSSKLLVDAHAFLVACRQHLHNRSAICLATKQQIHMQRDNMHSICSSCIMHFAFSCLHKQLGRNLHILLFTATPKIPQ